MAEEEKGASESSSVRDDILSAVAELETEAGGEQTTGHESANNDQNGTGGAARERDSNGRYARTGADEGTNPPAESRVPADKSANGAPDGRVPEAVVAPAEAALATAPNTWSAQAKAKWPTLDPELRAYITSREAEMHRGITKMDDERHFAKEMQRATAPYEAIIRASGVSIPQAVEQVLNTAYILRTADPMTKAREIAQVCQQYGVDLRLLAQPQGEQNPQVQALQQRLAQMEGQFNQRQQAEKQQLEQQVLNAVETFGQDPKHPHFKAVSAHMGALMQSGEAKDMDQAYEMAVWARPDIRSQLLAAQNAQQTQTQQTRQKTERARAKAVSVRGGPGGYTAPAQNPNMSVRESLEAAMAEVQARI